MSSYSGGDESIKEASISLSITASGEKTPGRQCSARSFVFLHENRQISTDINLSSRIIYWGSPFENTGSIPPKAEKQPTRWLDSNNTSNKVMNAQVKATLPIYVKWLSKISQKVKIFLLVLPAPRLCGMSATLRRAPASVVKQRRCPFRFRFAEREPCPEDTPIILNEATLFGTDNFTSAMVSDASFGSIN